MKQGLGWNEDMKLAVMPTFSNIVCWCGSTNYHDMYVL